MSVFIISSNSFTLLMKMSSPFVLTEHLVDSQHVREYPRAIATEHGNALKLAVKQYVPLDNPKPQPGDVTIVATHGSGFPKVIDSVPQDR